MASPFVEKEVELTPEQKELHAKVEKYEPFLPESIDQWRQLRHIKGRGVTPTHLAWAYLSDVFKRRGYDLYVPGRERELPFINVGGETREFTTMVYPAGYEDALFSPGGKGLEDEYGVLVQPRYIRAVFPDALVWPASNSAGKEFFIKVISDGKHVKGVNELRILEYLNRPDIRSDPRNRTVPVVEYIKHEQYTFAVFARWTDFPYDEIKIPMTAIESCTQVTEGLAFLHEQRIAHLDISNQNIMINFFGPTRLAIVVEDLPIKYGLIDFGESLFFEAANAEALAPPQDFAPRLTSAPEVSSMTPYDPFAADVYMTGMMFLEHFYDLTGFTPEFLPLLQSMTRTEPSARITMAEVHSRFAALRDAWLYDPDPSVVDVRGWRPNKYRRTYLNVRRPFPGSMPMPANDEEARALRQKMREDRQNEKKSMARWPTHAHLLHVDPVDHTLGCVHGNHAASILDS
ncbi:kinase-like domain-containing protein [Schizophyllum commune]